MYEAKSFKVTQYAWIVARYRLSYIDMETGATLYTSESGDVLLNQEFVRSAQDWGVPDGTICKPEIREVPTGGWVPANYTFKAVYASQQAAPTAFLTVAGEITGAGRRPARSARRPTPARAARARG